MILNDILVVCLRFKAVVEIKAKFQKKKFCTSLLKRGFVDPLVKY